MKNIPIQRLLLLLLLPAWSCHEVIFYPVKGSVSGIVTDNNGAPVVGITITASFYAPSQSPGQPPFPQTITSISDNTGYYRLAGLWDDVRLSADDPGFIPYSATVFLDENAGPVVDIALAGSPTIKEVNLSKQTLSVATADTVFVRMVVSDAFNNIPQGFQGNIILQTSAGVTAAFAPALLAGQSLENYLFDAEISSNDLPAGAYAVLAEVQDPDGHVHRINTGLNLQAL